MELEGSEERDLFAAANNGNLERIKELLQKGVDVNGDYHEFDPTPLTCAAENGHADCVKYLVEAGADVNCRDSDDRTALMYAITYELDDCVDILLESGAETEVVCGGFGETPLMMAAERGKLKCLSLLLKKGACVNHRDFKGYTALMYALNEDVVKMLLESGANVNQKAEGSKSSFTCSYMLGDDANDVTKYRNDGKTALFCARNEEVVHALVAAGANVNEKDRNDETALFRASWQNEKIVKALIEAGANMNVKDYLGTTPLFLAKNERIVKTLVIAGANVNEKDNNGKTALFSASSRKEKVVKALLEARADINVKDEKGETPLFGAGNKAIVKSLVVAGANVNEKSHNKGTPLCRALREQRVGVAKALVEAGADVNLRDNDGKPDLFTVLNLWNWWRKKDDKAVEVLRTLLSAGLKINVSDKKYKYKVGDGYTNSREVDLLLVRMLADGYIRSNLLDLLFAAGEEDPKNGNLPEYLPPQNEIILKHLCRKTIRKHLLEVDPHTHLFGRVPKLGLPSSLFEYLLYNQTLYSESNGDDESSVDEYDDDNDSYDNNDLDALDHDDNSDK